MVPEPINYVAPSVKTSPYLKRNQVRMAHSVNKYEQVSPSKSPGWQPFNGSNSKRATRVIGMHSADQPRTLHKSTFNPAYANQSGPYAAY